MSTNESGIPAPASAPQPAPSPSPAPAPTPAPAPAGSSRPSVLPENSPSPAPSPAPESTNDFRSSWPENFRTEPMFKNINTPEDLLKMAQTAQKLVGLDKTKVLRMPTEHSTDEERADFYSQLGRPQEPAKYTLPKAEEGKAIPLDDKAAEAFRKIAFDAGISDKQFQAITQWYQENAHQNVVAFEAQHSEFVNQSKAALKEKWGAAYNDRMNAIQDAFAAYGGKETYNLFVRTGAINHPAIAHMVSELGLMVREHAAHGGGAGAGGSGNAPMTPEQAKIRKNELQGDSTWMKGYRAGDKDKVAEMQRLNNFIYVGDAPRKSRVA